MIKIKKRIHVNLLGGDGDGNVDGVTHCRKMLKISIFGQSLLAIKRRVNLHNCWKIICGLKCKHFRAEQSVIKLIITVVKIIMICFVVYISISSAFLFVFTSYFFCWLSCVLFVFTLVIFFIINLFGFCVFVSQFWLSFLGFFVCYFFFWIGRLN